MLRHRFGEGGIVFGSEYVRLVEQDVEHDRLRILRSNVLDQLAVNRTRPRPGASVIVHFFERLLVDIDDHHFVRLRPALRVERQKHIPAALVDDPGCIEP